MVVLAMPRLGMPWGRFFRCEAECMSFAVEEFTSAMPLDADSLLAFGFVPGKNLL